MANFYIIVGTVMGTAFDVAKTIEKELQQRNHQVTLDQNYRTGGLNAHPQAVVIICTSNTGMGDLPENIAPLLEEFQNMPPKIVGRRYAIVNLGDSSYSTFGQAGRTIDEAFADLGAERIGDPLIIDAMEIIDAEAFAHKWLLDWLDCHTEQIAAGER